MTNGILIMALLPSLLSIPVLQDASAAKQTVIVVVDGSAIGRVICGDSSIADGVQLTFSATRLGGNVFNGTLGLAYPKEGGLPGTIPVVYTGTVTSHHFRITADAGMNPDSCPGSGFHTILAGKCGDNVSISYASGSQKGRFTGDVKCER